MNFIVASSGLSPSRLAKAHSAASALGSPLEDLLEPDSSGTWLAVSRVGDMAIRSEVVDGSATAVFGSGASRWIPSSDPSALLDGADDDLVGLCVDHRGQPELVAASGRGNHRVFLHRPPDGGLLACSHLATLSACLGPDLAIDRGLEDFLLGFGFLPDGRTVFEQISVLDPGKRATFGPSSAGHAERESDVAPPDSHAGEVGSLSMEEASEDLYERFMGAVEEQACGSNQHAVLLGGFDSALVAACLRRLGHSVDTYTFAFGDPRYEQRNAREVSEGIGATHHEVRIDAEVVLRGLEQFGTYYPQPGAQPHYQLHTLEASRRIAADGHDHVMNGDGCDAVFLGYPTVNMRARLTAQLSRVPTPVSKYAQRLLAAEASERHLGHVARMARATLANRDLGLPTGGHLPTRYMDEGFLDHLRVGPPPPQDESVEQVRRRLAEAVADMDPTRLAFHGNGLTGQSRAKVDGAVAATGVAQSTPFLHPTVKGFVSQLPTELLRPEGARASAAGKAVLIDMVRRHRLLPDWVIDMPKQSPSDSPIDIWYAGSSRQRILAQLEDLPFEWRRSTVDMVLRPKLAERLYRDRVSLGHHAFQVIGLLASYASFNRLRANA
ncbi:MAG: hypothetical protein GY812_10435 [Actinomycetia bacterium]|nr:hypothetical protein [Actinomycetes bacterium]